jgi:hypothetical protein
MAFSSAVSGAQEFAGLMFGEDAGNVIVHHHDIVDLAEPLPGEHADGGRAAAHPHALFLHTIDDGRQARLDKDSRAVIDGELDGPAVAEVEQGFAGDAAFLLDRRSGD